MSSSGSVIFALNGPAVSLPDCYLGYWAEISLSSTRWGPYWILNPEWSAHLVSFLPNISHQVFPATWYTWVFSMLSSHQNPPLPYKSGNLHGSPFRVMSHTGLNTSNPEATASSGTPGVCWISRLIAIIIIFPQSLQMLAPDVPQPPIVKWAVLWMHPTCISK